MNDTKEHLSDYERAIFYYTMPKITIPFPVGMVVIYVLMLFLALASLVYGVATEQMDWIRSGTIGICFAAIVGMGAFLLRDFINQVRSKSALASAKNVPDADSKFEDIPDPFKEHVLLRNPIRHDEKTMPLKNNKNITLYTASLEEHGRILSMKDESGAELFQASLDKHTHSFSFEGGGASQVSVKKGDKEIAEVIRHSSIRLLEVDIICKKGETPKTYRCLSGGILLDDELIGRVYEVRGYHYLDVQKAHLCEGILAFFATIG